MKGHEHMRDDDITTMHKNNQLNTQLTLVRAGSPENRRPEPAGVAHLLALRPSISDLEALLEFLGERLPSGPDQPAILVADGMDQRMVVERAIEIMHETEADRNSFALLGHLSGGQEQ